jgi:hypothetical protein
MSREAFFDNIRLAFGQIVPVVESDSPSLDAADLASRLRRTDLWLTPRSIEGYSPQDFKDLPPIQRDALERAVHEFQAVAEQVPPSGPATEEQWRAGWERFKAIIAIVRLLVLDEWKAAVDERMTEAVAWCHHHEWLAKRKEKKLKDRFLGEYSVPQLQIFALDNRLLLDPVARYAPGASGLLDLAVLPSYESVIVTRAQGRWYIQPVQEQGRRRKWSERAFVDTVTRLSALA